MSVNITQQMQNVLLGYTDEVLEKVESVLFEVGEDTAERFKTLGGFENRTGKYRKSWKVKQTKKRTYTETVVYATGREGSLTHLLEFGHANRNGGRTRAFPHISTNNEMAEKEAVEKITKAIEEISR